MNIIELFLIIYHDISSQEHPFKSKGPLIQPTNQPNLYSYMSSLRHSQTREEKYDRIKNQFPLQTLRQTNSAFSPDGLSFMQSVVVEYNGLPWRWMDSTLDIFLLGTIDSSLILFKIKFY